MTTRSTTLTTWAAAIANALETRGIDSRRIFAEVGLDIDQTQDFNARYLVTDMTNLWHICVTVTGDPAFGLRVPRFRSPTTFHGMGMAIDASATLRESLKRLIKLSRLVSNVGELRLHQREDSSWILEWFVEPEIRKKIADEALDAFLYSVAVRLAPEDLVEVYFVRQKPADAGPWQEAFHNHPIQFNANTDAVVLHDEAMDKPRQTGNAALAQAGETVALDYLQQLERDDVVFQVENEIRHRLKASEQPKQQEIAEALNLSVRQLQRKLANKNTCFAQLLQEIRHQLARKFLADPKRSIVEISLSLGFNDPSNFATAFRRWEGMSPRDFRQQGKK